MFVSVFCVLCWNDGMDKKKTLTSREQIRSNVWDNKCKEHKDANVRDDIFKQLAIPSNT
jgi:hypothetical protein